MHLQNKNSIHLRSLWSSNKNIEYSLHDIVPRQIVHRARDKEKSCIDSVLNMAAGMVQEP